MPAIYVDDPSTWPAPLRAAVLDAAASLCGTTEYCLDLKPTDAGLWHICDGLGSVTVTVFHATRLLPHELADIQANGLQLLTSDLLGRKLDGAVAAGALTPDAAAKLLRDARPLNATARRHDQVCASATGRGFRDDIGGSWRLVTYWGGEALSMAHEREDIDGLLRTLGTPTILEFTIPALRGGDAWYPPLENLLIGTLLDLDDVNGDVHIRSTTTPPTAVHVPGSTWWAQHPLLPTR